MSTIQTKILKPKLGFSKTTRKCISSMQSDGILKRYILSIQRVV